MTIRLAADRRLGWLAVLAGALLALAVQVAAPVGVPLYDGVVVQEPYRFLHPACGEAGAPGSYSDAKALTEDASPAFAAATTENPPQAQFIAQAGAFMLPTGATSLLVSITPIEAPAPPAGGSVVGNAYRFSVTDQAGNPLSPKTCDGCRSLLLRSPDGVLEAEIMRFVNGAWVDVETVHAGMVGLFQTNANALGDFAVIAGASTQPGPGVDPLVILGGGALLVWVLVVGFIVWRRTRPAPIPGSQPATTRGRIPSKRKVPRRPPPGRSDR
ncbi:MAG: hypothetical protein ABIR64_05925 [Candidatus Limnocylindrales bacterium]